MTTPVVMKLRIGIFGGGVVGGGVCELLQKYAANGRFGTLGVSIEIAKVCVQNLDKPRDFVVSGNTQFVTCYDDILQDASINCVG